MPIKQLNPGNARSRVEHVLARLSYEDTKLARRPLDTAVAGADLARQPWDVALRADVAEAWNSIRPVIANHIASKEEIVLPWAKMRDDFPPVLIMRTHKQHLRLRYLADTIDAVSFITSTDEEVVKAATALTAFTAVLGDVIDGEERDLFPTIQRFLGSEISRL